LNEIRIHQDDSKRRLTSVEFQQLTAMPAAADWFANIDNPRTRRAYQNDLEDFCSFVGLATADEFRMVTRSHVLACVKTLRVEIRQGENSWGRD
jgi:hypothetical protein